MDKRDQEIVDQLRKSLAAVIRGKEEAQELLLIGALAGGHVLIEDVPGVGKTTLAKTLARVLGLEFARVQFTPDLLPADILGSSLLDPRTGELSFKKGPVFAQLLLADEINRASPRTQSALLEAMNEGQVTLDGATHELPRPFFVIATQNPVDYQGTYPLPEAQLDRFLLRLALGYPEPEAELRVLFDRQRSDPFSHVAPVCDTAALLELQSRVRDIEVKEDVGRYIVQLVSATRSRHELDLGVSPRGALALFRAAQARAFVHGKSWVSPEDVQALAHPVLAHRTLLSSKARYGGKTGAHILSEIVEQVDVPT